ncbi:MAG: copper amine oxidase N-terminal domain-containing protein [Eubacteriales bacterium]|jgi:hypothetical protein
MKKKIIAVLLSLSILFLVTAVAEAAAVTNQVSISQVIKLIVNGKTINAVANDEPVIFKGRTFVPIRIVAEALNLKVDWDNKLKTVKITGKTTDSDANILLLAQKEKTIQDLTAQLALKNSEIQSLKDEIEFLKENDTDLNDLEDDLNSDYDYLEDVRIDEINLDGNEDDLDIDIEVNLNNYESKWAKLTDSEINSWIKSLVNSIQDELSEDTQVTGEIIDSDSDDTLVKFSKDGDDDLEVTFKDQDYRVDTEAIEDVEDDLVGDSFYVDDIQFRVKKATYYDSDIVTVTLNASTNNAASKWNSLTSSQITSSVKAIGKKISDTFEDDADVGIESVQLTFYDDDQKKLNSFKYDVDSGSLS